MGSLWIWAICPAILAAQHPDFNGVWRLRGPAGVCLLWICKKGDDLDLKTFSQNGKRYVLTDAVLTLGGERSGVYMRMPAKFTARWDDQALLAEWTTTWPWGDQTETHRYTLHGAELTDAASDRFGTRVRNQTGLFDREPPESARFFAYPEQTAGEHFKNVQILKGIPETELHPVMATFQTALGVKCAYCHSQSAYDNDALESKVTARKMLAMVADLNHREFGDRHVITCATCHRGKSIPDR